MVAPSGRDASYERFLEADLSRFKGMYVAIVDGRVVEHGRDPRKVYERAKEKFPSKEVVLWKVPEGDLLV